MENAEWLKMPFRKANKCELTTYSQRKASVLLPLFQRRFDEPLHLMHEKGKPSNKCTLVLITNIQLTYVYYLARLLNKNNTSSHLICCEGVGIWQVLFRNRHELSANVGKTLHAIVAASFIVSALIRAAYQICTVCSVHHFHAYSPNVL